MTTLRRFVVLGVLVLVVALAGCSGVLGPDDGPDVDLDEYDAQTLQADAVAATSDATTYAFAYQQELSTESTSGTLTLGVDADGTVDETEHLSRIDLTVSLISGDNRHPVDGEAYHVGETLYQRNESNWSAGPAASGNWSPTGQDVALLEGADVEITGSDTVQDRDVVVLDVEPATDEAIATYGLDQALVDDQLREDATIESVSVTQYVAAAEPHRIYRTEIELTIATPDSELTGTATRTYDDYDSNVTIRLPDDARK